MSNNTKLLKYLIQKHNLNETNQITLKQIEQSIKEHCHMVVYTSGKSLEEYSKMLSEDLKTEFGIDTKS